jgi:hypothetical protein
MESFLTSCAYPTTPRGGEKRGRNSKGKEENDKKKNN